MSSKRKADLGDEGDEAGRARKSARSDREESEAASLGGAPKRGRQLRVKLTGAKTCTRELQVCYLCPFRVTYALAWHAYRAGAREFTQLPRVSF